MRKVLAKALQERNAEFCKSSIKANLLRKELKLLRALRQSRGTFNSVQQYLDAGLWKDGNGVAAGQAVSFTFLEYQNMGATMHQTNKGYAFIHPRVLRPIDADREQIAGHLKAFQRPRKAMAKRQRTGERNNSVVQLMDCRPSAILLALTYKWQTTTALMQKLQGSAAFGKLTGDPLRLAIMREIRKPDLNKQTETRVAKSTVKYARTVTEIRRKIQSGDAG